jgi:hypothetical protein
MEPDNEKTSVTAVGAKRGLGRFPVLDAGDEVGPYRHLWAWALAGGHMGQAQRLGRRLMAPASADSLEALVSGRPTARLRAAGRLARPPLVGGDVGPGRVVAKSVHAPLAAGWLSHRFDVEVLVVLRHPANVLASWLELDLPDRDRHLEDVAAVRDRYIERWGVPAPAPAPLDRAVWQLGLMTAALEEACDHHPRWHLRVHEDLCADPEGEFRRLYGDLGLDWTNRTAEELEGGNRPGEGFALQRPVAGLADKWRTRLGPVERSALRRGLAPFPLTHWSSNDLAGDACAG